MNREHFSGVVRSLLRFLVLLLVASSIMPLSIHAGTEVSQRGSAPPGPAAPIRLQAATFVPAAGESADIPDDLSIESYPPGQSGTYIVQFVGPVREAWKEEVKKAGGVLDGYIPEFAFLVRMDDATRAAVAAFPEVASVSIYQPAFKLSPDLLSRQGTLEVVVQTFPGQALEHVVSRISALGAGVAGASASSAGGLIRLTVDAERLPALARDPAVRWIEPYYPRVLFNDVARSDTIMAAETAWADLGIYGDGQIVAIADTGLDTGNVSTLHQDFLGTPTGCSGTDRIEQTYALGRTGDWSDSCRTWVSGVGFVNEGGHGTHVTGSVLGNGCRSGSGGVPDYAGSYAGLAPQASLVFQSVMDSACELGGIPSDLNDLFSQARNAGARIHTNSWGAPVGGEYNTDSSNTDLFTWNNKDYTILFSAGNEGVDANSDGYVDNDSIGAPATAKNAITVGASENYRLSGGASGTYGDYWPSDFPANPIRNDPVSDNATGMVAFSSRGPTDDGRIKPDVVAPGSNILSTKSQGDYVSGGWGDGPNQYYQYMGGTSMATPLTAGAVALIREFYTDIKGVTPSSALLKATLINSATDLYPGQYASPVEQNPRLPNYAQGWGRVNVADAVSDTREVQDVDDASGVATGDTQSYEHVVCNASALKATLVWTDYPGGTYAAKELVNDLDLIVTAPDGVTTYLGNNFADGWSITGGAADRLNNVESVYVESPAAGSWTVAVDGYNVPSGNAGKQGYALVVDLLDNDCFSVDVTPATLDVCAPDDAVYDVAVGGATWPDPVSLSVSDVPAGTTTSFSSNPVTPPGASILTVGNTAAASDGSYTITVTGSSGGLDQQDTAGLNLSHAMPGAPSPTTPVDGSTDQPLRPAFAWEAVAGAFSYEIQIATDPGFSNIIASASGLTESSYTPASDLASATAYYWHVQAVNSCGASGFSPTNAFVTSGIATESFCRSPNLPIPDNNSTGVSDDQTVTASGILSVLDVSVQATHSWVGDLIFAVKNMGTGDSVTIIDRPGRPGSTYGCSQNHVNATLDDGATVPVEDECATSTSLNPPPYAIDGTFTPNNPLSVFNDQQLATTWRLTASDHAGSDTGTLTQWCLIATYGNEVNADYSDLPSSYGAAWHTGSGDLRLGAGWTADTSFAADADDPTDDGVTFVGDFPAGGTATMRVHVQGTPMADRWLQAWFDWNDNDAFDAGELAYDGAVSDGDNDLSISVPATVSDAVRYRVRLYDSAGSPGSSPLGSADGGEVEDGTAPCVLPAAVTGQSLERISATQVRLTWDPAAGADAYEVWRALDDPYFAPGSDCGNPAPYECWSAAGTTRTLDQSAVPGEIYTYAVLTVNGCGATSSAPVQGAAEFTFEIVPGDGP